jgi:hypothetical protein
MNGKLDPDALLSCRRLQRDVEALTYASPSSPALDAAAREVVSAYRSALESGSWRAFYAAVAALLAGLPRGSARSLRAVEAHGRLTAFLHENRDLAVALRETA